ncbi:uncharacterized protein FFB14_08302 [Fusarium fujikuroi]|nr:uncharacterized protein FFB14_08302 [Fusarium fujikuroi]
MSYSSEYDPQVGQALLLLTQFRSMADCKPLGASSYNLTAGCQIRDEDLRAAIAPYVVSYASSPDAISARRFDERSSDVGKRRRDDYRKRSAKAIDTFVKHLQRQWPSEDPKKPEDPYMELTAYIRMGPAMESALGKWHQWLKNLRLRKHLDIVADYMREDVPGEFIQVSPVLPRTLIPTSRPLSRFVATSDLFSSLGVLHHRTPPALGRLLVNSERDRQSNKLSGIIENLDSKAKLDYEHRYLRELKDSLSSLHGHVESELKEQQLRRLPGLLQDHLARCESHLTKLHETLLSSLSSSSTLSRTMFTVLDEAGFLPRVSPTQILQQLRPAQWKTLSAGWKESLIHYGLAITSLQQAKRLIRFQSSHVDLIRELENGGHQSWCPFDHPEWLLLECESEIMIRDVQQQIAEQMINPPDSKNSVMQLNMGEGKSTVIVPIVATALGDRTKLVRVIVAKPQAKQMHQMLISKLSGLLDRPVYMLPFSRDTKMDLQTASTIQCLMKRCTQEGGVLMVQPEHLLSFQLMELECRIRGDIKVAEAMSQTRKLFDRSSRDIVDESDENFSVKFELIYTLGKQRPIENSPNRWVVIQEVMGLIAKFGPEIKSKYPHSIEFDARHVGRYPRLRILRPDAEAEIFNRVTEMICETGMAGFPIARQPKRIRDAVQRYISQAEPTASDIDAVEKSSLWSETYSTQAVVFFNNSNKIIIIDRSGKIEDFQTCPFSQQLDLCLVFLDKAHTRRTDLKIPAEYRALVTLGAGLTKDRLVQACMRMRKLGKGQTVEFCIPWEIEHKIVQLKGESTPNRESISVSDVLCWAITETCLDLKRAMPLWLTQGVRFFKQEALWSRLSNENIKPDEFLEEEEQSLRERYLPQKGLADLSSLTERLNDSTAKLFKSRCEEFGLERLRTCSLQEEQERELAPETQYERQVEKVPALKPDTHSVNRLLQEWIAHGSFPESSTAFRTVMKPAFQSLNKTSAVVHFDVKEFPETAWVSMDFAHTVKGAFGGKNYSDSYQRPVQWVLVGKNEEGAPRIVVISPFEAQHFLPLIEESEHVALHLYAPRVNLGFQSLDDLQLYSVGKKVMEEIPRDIITFLNLFAGQLYLSSYDDYKLVCDLLCLAWDKLDDDAVGGSGSQCGFTRSLAMFLKELLEKVRQDCGTIDKTDMGRVIEGAPLVEDDFDNRHAI